MAGIPSSITVEKIALFIKYLSEDNFDACEIYIISDNQFLHFSPIIGNDFPFVLNAIKSDDDVENISFYYQLDSIFDADLNLIKKPGPKYEIRKATFPVHGEKNLYQVLWEEDKTYFISGKYEIFAVSKSLNGKLRKSNRRFVEVK